MAGGQLPLCASSRAPWRLCFLAWFFRGRDLPGTGTIVVNYEAPDGLRPAEVGTLIDEKVDLRDISATIIDLAVRGYIRIEAARARSSWFSSGSDYRFIKLKGPEGLKDFEKRLYDQIFGDGDGVRAERPPGEVLPRARAGQGRPLPGPEQGQLLRRQPRDGPGDVPRPGHLAGRRRSWPPPA